MPRLRLLPLIAAAIGLAFAARLDAWIGTAKVADPGLIAPALAQAPPVPAPVPQPASPQPADASERALLESLRSRRLEIEAQAAGLAAREQMLAAAEHRLGQRVEELTALQQRLEALERERAAREDAGLRGLVRLYEGMRPREAALIFQELEMPVLLPIVDRMREARAAPILAAMLPDRARQVTAELARLRAGRVN
jgi:flagellar motility protein MotE (MotC chaperone)